MNSKHLKNLLTAALVSSVALLAGDEEVLSAFTNASWVTPHWRKFDAMNEFLSIRGWVDIHSKRSFEVEPEAEYELSGMFRTPEAQGTSSRFEFGFEPIDEAGNVIPPYTVQNDPASISTLAVPAKIGDTTVQVKKTTKWKHGFIAFNAKPDFSDLPNRETVQYDFSKVEEKGDILVLTLKAPLKKDYPAGCTVRDHLRNRLWTVNRHRSVPKEWTRFTGRIKGIGKNAEGYSQWWPGTARARIFLLVPDNTAIEFKDITVTKITE